MDAVMKTYSKEGNASQIFELKKAIHNSKQGNLSVTIYYTNLQVLWQELDVYQHWARSFAQDAAKLAEILQRKHGVYSAIEEEESRKSGAMSEVSLENSALNANRESGGGQKNWAKKDTC
ncbi:hypothetical protein JRO89_XS15G0058600 [Xanthoceras sorbifolium]|uniref:Retrotransposon gag domain-containing protein n=1 Tax=Xanthoceras sorbifolium TaxID=99658 RepID=A0ABQ8H123_9ROSI|nr:hypothetical protein JRO89_XS15G0058600 [Xanthoceras sorbifolium]